MVSKVDPNNPSFHLASINNNRTAWRSFGLPVILVVPHRTTPTGEAISNSQVFNVRIFIEDVPREARVAGHDHVGLRFPDRELYAESVDSLELADRLLDIEHLPISRDGESIDYADANNGDLIEVITSTGITTTVEFRIGAVYYDLSDFTIETELLPSGRYNLVYQTEYFTRVVSNDGTQDLLCIDATQVSLAILRFTLNHPGDVLDEFHRLTPAPYLSNASKAEDTTLALYRPFTDTLQDIMDEQDLLESINWVFDAPAEVIPYLSSLLGWDLPYFPESLDQLRRAVLRRTVEFQNLKGSKQAIINIFRLFGFEILISNLWWSSDGKRLIRPEERLPAPYQSEEIKIVERCQIDAIFADWRNGDFGEFDIPLLFRPQQLAGLDDFTTLRDGGNVTIDCYFVDVDSPAWHALTQIITDIQKDPTGYGEESHCTETSDGFLIPTEISNTLTGLEVVGYSQILISGKLGQASDTVLVGPEVPLRGEGTSLDRNTNMLSITFNGALDVIGEKNSSGRAVFAFATYKRQEFLVPDVLKNLQSNRFDVQVVTEDFAEFADPTFLEFTIEFLFRLKAFHSLLYRFLLRIELTETYEVTDFCVGGDIAQRFDIAAGQLQVPPAIIPDIPGDMDDCVRLDPKSLGYKDTDILLRLRKLANLPEEHAAWKALDGREDFDTAATRIAPASPADRDECKFTHRGQDRIVGDRVNQRNIEYHPSPNANSEAASPSQNPNLAPIDNIDNDSFNTTGGEASSNSNSALYGPFTRESTKIRDAHCELDGTTDYCYKGRVDDELLYRPTVVAKEVFHCKPCSIDLGAGVYYTFPAYSQINVSGTHKPCPGSRTQKIQFTGQALGGNQQHHLNSSQKDYLIASYNTPLPPQLKSYLGHLLQGYDCPSDETLHFTNRKFQNPDQRYQLAIQRPSLNIIKPTLHLPGCRFPRLNALENDFSHPTWSARPWDDAHSAYCGVPSACGEEPKFLNAEMIEDTDGNETLIFEDVAFTVIGNNLIPDIPSLGDHSLGTNVLFGEDDVIHKVYMKDADANPAIVFDQVCSYDTAVAEDGSIEIEEPLFTSHNECGTGIVDFADGYACVSGVQALIGEDLGRNGLFDEVLTCLGVPTLDGTDAPSTILVLLSSGIRSELGLRLDCGCLLIDCDTTSEGETICSSDLFLDDDGEYDWDCDHIQVEPRIVLNEPIGACSINLDATIPSLLEV